MPRPTKRDLILKTAGDLFIEEGYHRVTIDQIVAAVPVSKPTLYANFEDKSDLFLAVIQRRCGRLMKEMESAISTDQEPADTLYAIGYQFLSMVLSKQSIQLHRILTAEISEFPQVAKLFYHSGPEQMHRFLSNYLVKEHKQKRLNVPQPDLAADMFLSMIKGYIHLQRLLGIGKPPSKKQMRDRVNYAVEFFLQAHGVKA